MLHKVTSGIHTMDTNPPKFQFANFTLWSIYILCFLLHYFPGEAGPIRLMPSTNVFVSNQTRIKNQRDHGSSLFCGNMQDPGLDLLFYTT